MGEPINALRVIDTQTRLDARAPIALPHAPNGAVAVSPNGRRVYLAASGRPTMVVDTVTGDVALKPDLPTVGALSGDGRRMYFAQGTVDVTTGQRWPAGSTLGWAAYGGADGAVYAVWCSQYAPSACEGQLSPRRHARVPVVEQARRFQSPLHDECGGARRDGGQGVPARRLRTGRDCDVRAVAAGTGHRARDAAMR